MSRAVALLQDGRIAEAASAFEMALEQNAHNPEALIRLSAAYLDLNKAKLAESTARRLVKLQPDYATGWKALGTALNMQFKFSEAADAYLEAARLSQGDVRAAIGAAQMLLKARRFDEAVKIYEEKLQANKSDLPSLLGLGHAQRALGRRQEAMEAYRRAVAIEPRFGQAWWSIANLKTGDFTDAERAKLKGVETDFSQGEAKAGVQFALAKAYEDEAEDELAFEQYRKANKTARAFIPYDAQADEAYTDRIKKVFSQDLLKCYGDAGCDRRGPIFVVGMPRSGSTLIEQILASHSTVEGLGELPSLGQCLAKLNKQGSSFPEILENASRSDLTALGEGYFKLTESYRSDRPNFVDKMPNNFFLVGLIALTLPNAVIIDARRHPMDSCISSFKQLFAKGQAFSYGLDDIARYYRLYDQLMKHWNRVLPGRILRVDYETLVVDQENQTRRMLDHCGLAFETQCLRFHETQRAVSSASSEQVRTPLYTSGLQSWRRYERQLAPLQDALRDIIDEAPNGVKTAGL